MNLRQGVDVDSAATRMTRRSVAGPSGSISYLERPGSSGRVVLLIHGTRLQGRAWTDVVRALPVEVACIAVDLSGHGSSTRQGRMTVSAWAADCEAVLDHLGVSSVDIVGSSLGAAVAVEMAGRRPNGVRSLTLFGGLFLPAPDDIAELNRAAIEELGPMESMRRAMREVVFAPGTPEETVALAGADVSEVDTSTAHAIDAGTNATDVRSWLSSLACRVLVATGDADVLAPASEAEWFAGQVGGDFVSMPGVGHLSMYDAPALTAELITSNVLLKPNDLSSHHKESTEEWND